MSFGEPAGANEDPAPCERTFLAVNTKQRVSRAGTRCMSPENQPQREGCS